MRTVDFHSVEELREQLKAILLEWLPRRAVTPVTSDYIGVTIDMIYERRMPSVRLTIYSSMRRRRQARRPEDFVRRSGCGDCNRYG